jgi:hypothetical protein
MVDSTRESGRTIVEMAEGLRDTLIITPTSAHSRMEKHMERVYISGSMGRCMTENGNVDLNMAMEFGRAQMDAILTLENGSTQRLKAMAFISGKTAIDMKESGNSV